MKKFAWFLLCLGLVLGLEFVHSSLKDAKLLAKESASQPSLQSSARIPLAKIPVAVAPSVDQVKQETPTQEVAQSKPAASSNPPAQTKAAPKPKPKVKAATVSACKGSFAQEFLCLLNEYRVSKGLSKLSSDKALSKVALSHSEWMNATGTFSHTGANGYRLGQRCEAAGIVCRGENLAKGASSPKNLLDLWKRSPAHNAILLGAYSTMGLGVSGKYTTLLFN